LKETANLHNYNDFENYKKMPIPFYPISYIAKLKYDHVNNNNIIVLPYDAPIGDQINPEAAFQYALGLHDSFLITKQATQAWNNYITAMEMLNSSKQAVSAGVTALSGKQKEYDEGQISLTELLDMQENLLKYKIRLADVTKDFKLKLYNMDYVMGSLTASNLKLPTKIYNPVANYDKIKYQLIGF
jgi:hypothetical protein